MASDWCQNTGITTCYVREVIRLAIIALDLGEWMSQQDLMCRHNGESTPVEFEFSGLTNSGHEITVGRIYVGGPNKGVIEIDGEFGEHRMNELKRVAVQF